MAGYNINTTKYLVHDDGKGIDIALLAAVNVIPQQLWSAPKLI